jgi:hypothetical protein
MNDHASDQTLRDLSKNEFLGAVLPVAYSLLAKHFLRSNDLTLTYVLLDPRHSKNYFFKTGWKESYNDILLKSYQNSC